MKPVKGHMPVRILELRQMGAVLKLDPFNALDFLKEGSHSHGLYGLNRRGYDKRGGYDIVQNGNDTVVPEATSDTEVRGTRPEIQIRHIDR
jgi:hypothetical protein